MLGGTLLIDGVKMSKSLGNFVTIKDALERHRPEALRMFILSGLYRSPADFSEGALEAASKGSDRLNTAARRVREALKNPPDLGPDATPEMTNNLIETLDQMRMRFASAMNDDFNAPLALSVLFDLGTEANRWIDKGIASREALEQADNIFRELGGDVLGVIRAVEVAGAE